MTDEHGCSSGTNEGNVEGDDAILESFERFMRRECGLAESDPLPYEHPYVSASWPVWEAAWRLAAERAQVAGGPRYRHLKTGGVYEVLTRGLNEADLTPVVIYRNVASGQVWVRSAEQFDDGRFAPLDGAN
ncbi:MAG: DUF1653 domain-containing protein [Burkholderiaceae bacterium]